MSSSAVNPYTDPPNLFAAFELIAMRQPDHPALVGNGGKGPKYSYAETLDLARRLASGLVREGTAEGPGIGLIGENCPQWSIAYLSILAAGGTVIPIDANLKPEEIGHIVHHSGLRATFTSGLFERQLKELRDDLAIFSFDESSPQSWTRLMPDNPPKSQRPPAEVASVIYTSGTTGAPKAVELTHRNILANLEGFSRMLRIDSTDVALSLLPLHHTFEATCGFLTPLTSGATIVYARSMKSKEVREDIAHNRVTIMIGVPLLYEKMYHSFNRKLKAAPWPRRWMFHSLYGLSRLGWAVGFRWGRVLFRSVRDRAGLGSVRMFFSGAAALPRKMARFFNLIGLDLLEGYGMTETSPVVSVNRPGSVRFGSVGPPLDNVQVRIHNPDPAGIGEITVRGDNITRGYRDNPQETAALIVDGWLYTGDLGRLDKGHLWITGRRKNIIVSAAGKNIYPEELEEKLLESDCVLEVVVFGRPKEGRQGEDVRAVIVPDMDQFAVAQGPEARPGPPDEDHVTKAIAEVVHQVNERVASYKRIAAFDVRFEELEKTSTKKVKRFLYE
ncbi:MAG: AMP-binding protein [candidate division Zixibacteria bacterium]|nr:AMP-binding protein [candidate division Zixibacteria bacterium]